MGRIQEPARAAGEAGQEPLHGINYTRRWVLHNRSLAWVSELEYIYSACARRTTSG